MPSIEQQILQQSARLPEGAVLAPKAFLHLGTRAAVDQALFRLARGGELLRVGRGRYVRPVRTRFGMRAPSPAKVVEHLATLTGETIVPSGAAAANALGLTKQVPIRSVFLTSGRSRRLELGRQLVELRQAPPWLLWAPQRKAGGALRALAWLGPEHAPQAASRVMRLLSPAERAAVLPVRGAVPSWLSRAVTDALRAVTGEEPAAD